MRDKYRLNYQEFKFQTDIYLGVAQSKIASADLFERKFS